ncbi:MAG: primosomal protein N' [Deltaproteobacteria bacterium]|nr:primosomal protein N' [Deltaproteobacteria bacterium]MBN2671822.1 primosomal protein N' [Deltaproteobacteria bacterium]
MEEAIQDNNFTLQPGAVDIWLAAVPVPLRKLFAYRVLPGNAPLQPGMRVLVPFGNRRLTAYLVEPVPPGTQFEYALKTTIRLLDDVPTLPMDLLRFLQKCADYYLHPIGEVLRTALPAGMDWVEKQGALKGPRIKDKQTRLISVNPKCTGDDAALLRRAPKRAKVLAYIRQNGPVLLSELRQRFSDASLQLKKLEADDWVYSEEKTVFGDPFKNATVERDLPPTLNGEQLQAVEQITSALHQHAYGGFLLHGITGSGKTEVYLHAAKEALAQGKGVLVLVPEITLTPQLVARYRARFGDDLAVLHSGLSDRERYDQWKRLHGENVHVAIGVRSALFAPIRNLGLIMVDEEHDSSFKQERGFSYNARDLALLRASLAGAVAVLGSATPSLESFHNAQIGKLKLLQLTKRATDATLPAIELVHLANHKSGPKNQSLISGPLFHEIEQALAKRQQVILFLNRRGFAPNLVCHSCGTVIRCTDCAVSMTLHRRPAKLVCHYCGATRPEPSRCPTCNSPNVSALGTGTQKVEELLQTLFPTARVGRLDRDVAGAGNAEQVLNQLKAGELDILVGTQMITKGHDFPSVTLVGVIQSDVGLHMPDFRASERTFQLLTQVAGRAGRADLVGRALVQTYSPEHPAVACARRHDYLGFAAVELEARKELGYPPFGKLAALRLNSPNEQKVEDAARSLMVKLRDAWHQSGKPTVSLLGPSPAPLAFLQNRYRWQIFLKAPSIGPIRSLLQQVIADIESPPNDVRIRLDIDPVSMM